MPVKRMPVEKPGQPADPIVFVVTGERLTSRGAGAARAQAVDIAGTLKDAVRLSRTRATGVEKLRVSAVPGHDVVVLRLDGGPVLVLHPASARDLLLAQGSASSVAAGDAVDVPAELGWFGLEQAAPTRSAGTMGGVLLASFEVITSLPADSAADFAASLVVRKVDGQVDAGVYALSAQALTNLKSCARLRAVPAPGDSANQPLLVLIHGTFVDTFSTFGKLWTQHPRQVTELFDGYGGRVYALDHPTLGASPIGNALTLVQALPAGARLHLLTHSRGGLVAEVLARVAAESTLAAADLAHFPGAENGTQRRELRALAAAVRDKGIRVDRVVRVACPARGTLLASRRLDAYLSVLRWALERAGIPVLPELLEFLTEVARRRADPALLPGLAAMIPDSPLLNWFNGSQQAIPGDLRVVAGDMQGDSVGSWVKTLLADAYYWSDNDIVVQTRSMYGGVPRQNGASFLLDQGGKVNHFNYFSNERSVLAIVHALMQDEPAGFRTIGPLSWAGRNSGGARSFKGGGSDKPAVFLLPGILGSHLKADDQRIWLSLHLIGGLSQLRYQADGADGVQPDGTIGAVYDDLAEYLSATHEVIIFGYDWRCPIEVEACRLGAAVEQAMDMRSANGQPVSLLAHSTGGLLARTLQLECPAVFDRLMTHRSARLLMLGTPNAGLWTPMQVLSGDETFGNALASFGSPQRDAQARQLMAGMPGFLQLQAGLLDPALKLGEEQTWIDLAREDLSRMQQRSAWHRLAGLDAYRWGLPSQSVLDHAVMLRRRLDAQLEQRSKASYADRILLVVGQAPCTPDGFGTRDQAFVYQDATGGGDGRVPLASALLPGVRAWTLDCEHGSLPWASHAFEAYLQLLLTGETHLLETLQAKPGGEMAAGVVHVPSRPSRGRAAALPADSERSVFGLSARVGLESGQPAVDAALRVSVLNGNLSFVPQPLMVGHTRSLVLTGTEAVVDKLVGGLMKDSLDAGLYPDEPGAHKIFRNSRRDPENPWRAPQPDSVIVVGLGDEGGLTEQKLSRSVCQGVIAWSQRTAEDGSRAPVSVGLSATLLGSGGVGIGAGNAARAIAQGVREANDSTLAHGWPRIGHLTLVELYLDRASEAWHGLQVLAAAAPDHFDITPTIGSGVGALRRPIDSSYRGTDYDIIAATSTDEDIITFALDTRRARTEVHAQSTQGKALRLMVAHASSSARRDPRLGHTLFQLLVPPAVEPFMAGTSRMLLELDAQTAPIPWELLDTGGDGRDGRASSDPRPWAIRTQLLRKLRQTGVRPPVQDATRDDGVLIIGEPRVDRDKYPALEGARAEARAVQRAFSQPGQLNNVQQVTALIDDNDATSILNALFAARYRIVHVAGHGEPMLRHGDGQLGKGGVVLSEGSFLGPDEIRNMRTVPELVFVNCCHLAARDSAQVLHRETNRTEFAAGVADSLIALGVRCVIAAGWAVDDSPAQVFAVTFYREILARKPFIAAAATAREAAWRDDPDGQTWAAYQCYGDPDWVFREGSDAAAHPGRTPAEEFEGLASPLGLALALEEQAVRSRWMGAEPADQLEKLRHLEARFEALWGDMGAVAEAFGVAYAEAGADDAAIRWYRRALASTDCSASIKVQEQLCERRARRAWDRARTAAPHSAEIRKARAEIMSVVDDLRALLRQQPSLERYSLLGSAWKRCAMTVGLLGRTKARQEALKHAAAAYAGAEAVALATRSPLLYHPALNRMALELLVHLGEAGWQGFDTRASAAVRESLTNKIETDPDFTCHAGLAELDAYEAMTAGRLARRLHKLRNAYADLQRHVSSPRLWRPVADQGDLVLSAYAAAMQGAEGRAATALRALLLDCSTGSV